MESAGAHHGKKVSAPALAIEAVEVDDHCVGSRWTVGDMEYLARLIAIIAMGQARHAARIVAELQPSEPAINAAALRMDAKQRLAISGKSQDERDAARWHRDGLIFEAISWIAARQTAEGEALLKDPHISATTQGLDGLMIELDPEGMAVARATIFEDKCSTSPRAKFRDEILPTFKNYHVNRRASGHSRLRGAVPGGPV